MISQGQSEGFCVRIVIHKFEKRHASHPSRVAVRVETSGSVRTFKKHLITLKHESLPDRESQLRPMMPRMSVNNATSANPVLV